STDRQGLAGRPGNIRQEDDMQTVEREPVPPGEIYGQQNEQVEPEAVPQVDIIEEPPPPADTALPAEQSAVTEGVPGDGKYPEVADIAGQPDETGVQPQPLPKPIKDKKVVLGLRSNSPQLTDEGRREFDAFVETLQPYPRATLLVKGYVSAKTNSPENILLSEERARGVEKLLLENGIPAERIEVKGMGNQEPLASNDTREGRRQNRRVEIIVIDDGL
ncbi:MAG: OmpA family protein, partial [Desulforhopalus sp.]